MGCKKFIFSSALDAFSYLGILLVSGLIPAVISMIKDAPIFFMITIFIAVCQTLREYMLLINVRPVSSRFWIERFVGIASSVIACLYSLIMVILLLNDLIDDKNHFYSTGKIIILILFSIPLFISLIEGILYLIIDYKANVVRNSNNDCSQVVTEDTSIV